MLLYKPEQAQLFTGFLINLLGIVTVAAGTFYGLDKLNNRVEQVQEQTNGTLTKLLAENVKKGEENKRLTERNAELETRALYLPRKARKHVGQSTHTERS